MTSAMQSLKPLEIGMPLAQPFRRRSRAHRQFGIFYDFERQTCLPFERVKDDLSVDILAQILYRLIPETQSTGFIRVRKDQRLLVVASINPDNVALEILRARKCVLELTRRD